MLHYNKIDLISSPPIAAKRVKFEVVLKRLDVTGGISILGWFPSCFSKCLISFCFEIRTLWTRQLGMHLVSEWLDN